MARAGEPLGSDYAQFSEDSLIGDFQWHLVLYAELSALLHPGGECAVPNSDHLGGLDPNPPDRCAR
jgi:hypothetical protein